MNGVLVARNNGVNWRIPPRARTFEAELVFVVSEMEGMSVVKNRGAI
jgi:hypothetical protein